VYEVLQPLLGGTLNVRHILAYWKENLRLATAIKQGTVMASLMLRKLGSYPRQNGLAVALRGLGRIERSLFILDWLQSIGLRRRVQVGLTIRRSPQRARPDRLLPPVGRNSEPGLRATALPRQWLEFAHGIFRFLKGPLQGESSGWRFTDAE